MIDQVVGEIGVVARDKGMVLIVQIAFPVFAQLLGAHHQRAFAVQLEGVNHRQRGIGLA